MTVPPARDQLRADVELGKELTGTYYADEDPDYYPAMKRIFEAVPRLFDQLDAAEQCIRDLTQEVRDERGAARDQMEQVRIRDARIRAVRELHVKEPGVGTAYCIDCEQPMPCDTIRALDPRATNGEEA